MKHDSILVGTEVGEQSLEYTEPNLANLVALPGFGGYLADRYYEQAEIIERQVQAEVEAEIEVGIGDPLRRTEWKCRNDDVLAQSEDDSAGAIERVA